MDVRPIKRMAILGNGIAAWAAANHLATVLVDQTIELTVIADAGTRRIPGVSTTPLIHDLHRRIGLSNRHLVSGCAAGFKLGNRYRYATHDAIVPFDPCGEMIDGVDFHHYLHRLNRLDLLDRYSLAAAAARARRFDSTNDAQRSVAYAWHLDGQKYCETLRRRAIDAGVRQVVTIGPPELVADADDSRHIRAINTQRESIATDFVFDASDWSLARNRFDAAREDWSGCLPVAGIRERIEVADGAVGLLTEWTVDQRGWVRKIPLSGHTVMQRYLHDDGSGPAATDNHAGHSMARSPGRLRRHWRGNYLALGKAAGDPLDFVIDELHLTMSALFRWLDLYPDLSCQPRLSEEFNRLTNLEYDRVRDAHAAHFWPTGDSMPLSLKKAPDPMPAELAWRVELFQAVGKVAFYEADSLAPSTWISLLTALGLRCAQHDQLADRVDHQTLQEQLDQMAHRVRTSAQSFPLHNTALARYAQAQMPGHPLP